MVTSARRAASFQFSRSREDKKGISQKVSEMETQFALFCMLEILEFADGLKQ